VTGMAHHRISAPEDDDVRPVLDLAQGGRDPPDSLKGEHARNGRAAVARLDDPPVRSASCRAAATVLFVDRPSPRMPGAWAFLSNRAASSTASAASTGCPWIRTAGLPGSWERSRSSHSLPSTHALPDCRLR